MAKRAAAPKTAANPEKFTVQPAVGAQNDQEADIPAAIAAINALSGADSDGTEWDLRVFLLNGSGPRAGKALFLRPIEVDDLSQIEMNLAEEYPGGGDFRITCRRNGQLFKNVFISLAPRPGYRPPAPTWQQPAPLAAPAPAADPLLAYLQRMEERQMMFMEKIVDRLSAPTAPPLDANTIISQTMGMFKTFQESIPKTTSENSMQLIKDGIELGKMISGAGGGGGEGEGGGGLAGMISNIANSEFGKAIAQAITKPQTQQPQTTQRPAPARLNVIAPGPQAGKVKPAPATQPPQSNAAPPTLQDRMNDGMNFLFDKAAAGADPSLLAEQVAAMIPGPVWVQLEEADDPVQTLEQWFPRVGQYRPFFEGLIANIFEEDNVPESQEGAHAAAVDSPS